MTVNLKCSLIFKQRLIIITTKQLAEIIKKDPKTFMEAFNLASQKYKEKLLDDQFEDPVQIETEGRVTFGNRKAPVTIFEFSDFQCPPCANASASLKILIEKYKGKVNLVFKHFPLDFHPNVILNETAEL